MKARADFVNFLESSINLLAEPVILRIPKVHESLCISFGGAALRASSHLAGQVERSSVKLLLFLGER